MLNAVIRQRLENFIDGDKEWRSLNSSVNDFPEYGNKILQFIQLTKKWNPLINMCFTEGTDKFGISYKADHYFIDITFDRDGFAELKEEEVKGSCEEGEPVLFKEMKRDLTDVYKLLYSIK